VSRVTVIWLFVASAYLTLCGIHLMIGLRRPRRTNLIFALTALSGAAVAVFELLLMRAETPERYGSTLRWTHVPIFFLVASIVLFVREFLGAGRWWLAWTAIATRGAASLLVNFLQSPNLNYTEIHGLARVPFLGEAVAVAQGAVSPWTRLGELRAKIRIPVVVITGHDTPEAQARAMKGGAVAYLRKPVDAEALLDAIVAAIGDRKEGER
jgi:two-component system, LuxR family, sensor kinase FixL